MANLEELKAEVYLNLVTITRPEWLAEHAIISPLNVDVDQLNKLIMNECPREQKKYKSVGTAMSDGEVVLHPVEFLYSLELTGMPPHILNIRWAPPSWSSGL